MTVQPPSQPFPDELNQARSSNDRPPTVIEGEVIEPSGAAASDSQTQTVAGGPRRASLVQLALGSALLVRDEVSERLIIEEEVYTASVRTPESVLRPVAEWEELFGLNQQPGDTTALLIGMTRDAGQTGGRSLRLIGGAAEAMAVAVGRYTGPIWRSRLLTPVRRPVRRLQERGEEQVSRWIAMGRQESVRSRALAESSITHFVTESVTDLSGNLQVQNMVQEVLASPDVQGMIEQAVASQSTSMLGSIIEEVRQRLLTLDILLERMLRRLFGRSPRETLPEPPFREQYVAHRQHFYKGRDMHAGLGGHYAGFATRFVAFTIDMLLLAVAYTLGTAFVTGTISLFQLDTFIDRLVANNPQWQAVFAGVTAFVSLMVVLGYGVLSWYLTGETVGNALAGVHIVGPDGGRVSFGRAVRRIIGAFIAAVPLFLGFFWVLLDNRRQGWHDKIAGTYAVYDWPAKVDEQFLREQLESTSQRATSS